jgi:hypothetical protein
MVVPTLFGGGGGGVVYISRLRLSEMTLMTSGALKCWNHYRRTGAFVNLREDLASKALKLSQIFEFS